MLRFIKPLILGAVVGLVLSQFVYFFANFLFAVSSLSENQLYQSVGSQTLMLVNPDSEGSGGTGFVVRAQSGRVYTLTNAHVCAVSQHPYLLAKQNEKRIRLQILDISRVTDLCILTAPPGLEGLPLANAVGFGQHINLIGHPFLQPLTMRTGYTVYRQAVEMDYCESLKVDIEEPRTDLFVPLELLSGVFGSECKKSIDSIWAALDSKPGNSGSSITNDQGEVVGVLYAGNALGTSLIVPLDQVRAFLSAF